MVYAFRHNGPRGVIAVPWDRAFFYLEHQSTNAAIGTTPCNARCHVLDEQGIVRHSFGFGTREVILGGESSPLGQGALERMRANFEFVRRYMEEGPAALPRWPNTYQWTCRSGTRCGCGSTARRACPGCRPPCSC